MKIRYIKEYLLALSVFVIPQTMIAQGIEIAAAGKIEVSGNAMIEISDGHFINNGSFTSGTGTVTFSGTSLQTLTSGGNSFYNIVFNNQNSGSSDINVTDPLSITGSATFTNGIIYYTGAGSAAFGSGAASTTGNASSFIDGTVSKTGTTAFTFPTGDVKSGTAVWAPLAIASPAASSTISAEYVFIAPAYHDDIDYFCDPEAFDFISSAEYWNISTTNATPEVTLFWNDGTRSGIQNLADLLIASWEDCSGIKWVDRGGTTTGTAAAGSITTTIPMTSYSKISFASQSGQNTLPVSLLDFSARCSSGVVFLEWTTASEINNNYFTLERSADLDKWTTVAKVPGAGNSNSLMKYSFSDQQSSTGDVYYRLIQTDFNGESETFNPVMVRCDEPLIEISCYPNPFTDQLVISLQNTEAVAGEIRLIDVTGRTVMYRVLTSTELTQNIIELMLPDMAAGVYSLEFRAGSYVKMMQVFRND